MKGRNILLSALFACSVAAGAAAHAHTAQATRTAAGAETAAATVAADASAQTGVASGTAATATDATLAAEENAAATAAARKTAISTDASLAAEENAAATADSPVAADAATTAAACASLRTITLCGRVTASGMGVVGVPVTDGRTIVRTDKRGRYRLPSDTEAEFVYLSVPAGYEIPTEDGTPKIYRRIEGGKLRYDFTLERSTADQTRHRLLVVADPQVYFESELDSVRRAAADIRRTASDGIPTVGVVCGDIIGDIYRKPALFEPVRRAIATGGVPFFYAVGNHDMDLGVRTNDRAKASFKAHFGPTYYSFDRGRVHYVVLDDNFYIARSYLYVGYLTERQLRWLEQDLAAVPAGRTVVVCMHIPTWSRPARRGEWGKEEAHKVLNNRRALYDLLKPYNAHILSAHEHYNENYEPVPHVFEHVHAPLSTLFWQTPWSMDGIPAGYGVYEIAGDSIAWHYKAVDHPRSRQFTAYGAGCDRHRPDAMTVNVWNWDPAWKVLWYENGTPRGEMTRYTGYDESIYDYVVRFGDRFVYKYIGADVTEHLFYAEPSSPGAAVRVEVVDRFGNRSVWDSATGYEQTEPK